MQRGPPFGECSLERRRELLGPLDECSERAERLGVGDEVGIDELGGHRPARKVTLLVHADRPVHPVVDQEHDDRGAVLDGGGELVPAHQEVAVAAQADDRPLRPEQLRGDRGRHAVAHRPGTGRELRPVTVELVEPVRPDRVVPGAVREHGVVRQPLSQVGHHLGQLRARPAACWWRRLAR